MKKRFLAFSLTVVLSLALPVACSDAGESGKEAGEQIGEDEEKEEVKEEEKQQDEGEKEEEQKEKEEKEEKQEDEEQAEEEVPDSPAQEEAIPYSIDVNWTYLTSSVDGGQQDEDPEVTVSVTAGTSAVDASSLRRETTGDETLYYYLVNGKEEAAYSVTHPTTGSYHIELLRDDLSYNVDWWPGPFYMENDCHAEVYHDGKLVDEAGFEERRVRSYTGAWGFGICSVTNGDYGAYDASWLDSAW